MADSKRRMVASEDNLRIALKQQLLHNEQQNLAMTGMSRGLGRAGRLATAIGKLIVKVDSGSMTHETFFKEVSELMSKFETLNSRGSKGAKRG